MLIVPTVHNLLHDISLLSVTDGNFMVGDGTTWVTESGDTVRTSLGLGSMAIQNLGSVNIDGGTIDGVALGATCTQTEWDAANTHIGESGASHTYIDQSVVSGANVAFGIIAAADGTAAVPSYTFSTDTDTGMYSDAANQIKFTVSGTTVLGLFTNVFTSYYYSNLAFLGPTFNFNRAKGTQGTPLAVTTDCSLMTIGGYGYMGSDYIAGGVIRMFAESNWSSGDCPTRMSFWTVPDGLSTIAERMRIDNAGNVKIGAGAPTAKLDVDGAIASGTATITASADDTDVSGINTLFINITGDIVLGGLTGGVNGQVLNLAMLGNFTNHVTIEHAEGVSVQDFINHTALDENISHGGCIYVCNGSDWYDVSHAKHV